ncbi:MAG TPA: response regulator [Gammaproteobacteria bacterium]|jgi:CheY-like chemotaxis protein|nr:response regulator [Gammaproteobacteria bacterium]
MSNVKNKHKPRILLIEDDEVIQFVIQRLLENIGYAVDVATTGVEALIKASKGYSLIFSDIGLPNISGIDVAKIIRAHEKKGSYTPIIGLTVFPLETIQDECISAGMDCVYSKPINEATLAEIITIYDKASLMA